MSLIINNDSTELWKFYDDSPNSDAHDVAMLDRYLAVMENNRNSNRFVPNDAMLALDMAGFVSGKSFKPRMSTARLSLALVQTGQEVFLQ